MRTIRVGNAAGFLGDQLEAPRLLAEGGNLDYLTLEHLAELTLSILAHQKTRNPDLGYAADFIAVLPTLIPVLRAQPNLKIVTNAGGMNPAACAKKVAGILHNAGLGDTRIGIVSGDDLLPALDSLIAQGESFAHFDTQAPFDNVRPQIASANAYLGAAGIVDNLAAGAKIVITGRVADASLTLGPAIHEFDWKWDDWDRLAAATVAGHIIECGAQATGGMFTPWMKDLNLAEVGYPIAEITAAGDICITKPAGTGGLVDERTVAEQLLYEIGDPAHYLTPDVDADFTGLSLEQLGPDRVAVRGAHGNPPPPTYKVSMAYQDGYMAVNTLVICGPDAEGTARHCADIILKRVERSGFKLERTYVECLGTGDTLPGIWPRPQQSHEVLLRISAHDSRKEALERFVREFAPLVTSGPAGVTGYTGPRGKPYPVLAYWPTRVDRYRIQVQTTVRTAADWQSS